MIIKNKEEFEEMKKILDQNYKHDHFGTPEKYPCKLIESKWYENIDSLDPDYYIHDFSYDITGE